MFIFERLRETPTVAQMHIWVGFMQLHRNKYATLSAAHARNNQAYMFTHFILDITLTGSVFCGNPTSILARAILLVSPLSGRMTKLAPSSTLPSFAPFFLVARWADVTGDNERSVKKSPLWSLHVWSSSLAGRKEGSDSSTSKSWGIFTKIGLGDFRMGLTHPQVCLFFCDRGEILLVACIMYAIKHGKMMPTCLNFQLQALRGGCFLL